MARRKDPWAMPQIDMGMPNLWVDTAPRPKPIPRKWKPRYQKPPQPYQKIVYVYGRPRQRYAKFRKLPRVRSSKALPPAGKVVVEGARKYAPVAARGIKRGLVFIGRKLQRKRTGSIYGKQ